MIDVSREAVERMQKRAWGAINPGSFFGFGLRNRLNDCVRMALALRGALDELEAKNEALRAVVEALRDAHAEQERYLHEAEALRARLEKADKLAVIAGLISNMPLPGYNHRLAYALAAYRATGE